MDDNLRIVYQNVADTATLAVSSSASASLGAANLKLDTKSLVWRATSTSGTITATWSSAQLISVAVLPYCNLTSTATIRVRGYTEVADTTPVFDTGTILACPPAALTLWEWGNEALGVNAYSYGGGAYARAWRATPDAVKKVVIDLVDSANTAGYIECSRLVLGNYWQSTRNPDYGASATPRDTSINFRNAAGDLMTDVGTRHRTLAIPLSNLSVTDRNKLWEILWGNGMSRPVLVSMFPDNTDTALEQTGMIYGKLPANPALAHTSYRNSATSLDIEEI